MTLSLEMTLKQYFWYKKWRFLTALAPMAIVFMLTGQVAALKPGFWIGVVAAGGIMLSIVSLSIYSDWCVYYGKDGIFKYFRKK